MNTDLRRSTANNWRVTIIDNPCHKKTNQSCGVRKIAGHILATICQYLQVVTCCAAFLAPMCHISQLLMERSDISTQQDLPEKNKAPVILGVYSDQIQYAEHAFCIMVKEILSYHVVTCYHNVLIPSVRAETHNRLKATTVVLLEGAFAGCAIEVQKNWGLDRLPYCHRLWSQVQRVSTAEDSQTPTQGSPSQDLVWLKIFYTHYGYR